MARSVLAAAGQPVSSGMPTSKLCELPALIARVATAVGDAATVRPAPASFALVEHAWHLADIEREAFQVRLARLAHDVAPWLANFDGDRLARERDYLGRALAPAVRAFTRGRAATVRALACIRGSAWLRGGVQEHVGYVTLGELPERILGHDKAHAIELAALVEAIRPAHPLAGELRRWADGISDAPASPCNRDGAAQPRTASALPLTRIQHAIATSILAGEVTTAALGRALGLSPRTLQRRVAAHGVTVRCLVEESLRALALARLRAGDDWRVAGLALGFGDARAFARAFKRWTRVTPVVFQHAPALASRGCA